MNRRLTILLLIVGCVYGDTIKYKSSLFVTDTKEKVKYLGVGRDKKVCFETNAVVDLLKPSGETYKHSTNLIDCIPCKSVKEIIDSSNEKIDFDCNRRTYYGKQPKQPTEKSQLITLVAMIILVFFMINAG